MNNEAFTPVPETTLRDRAVGRLKKQRDFHAHLLVYVLVNTCIVLVWVVTGEQGFFWPMFPIVFWGVGVVMNAWDVYHPEEFREDQISREMEKLRS
ncbi:MAG: 2TM domain-containing protein [Actinomycetes bacterium]